MCRGTNSEGTLNRVRKLDWHGRGTPCPGVVAPREVGLCGTILHIGRSRCFCAMCTAEEATTNFDSVSDYPTVAVFANWRHGLDCALKAVEGLSRASGDDIETLVIIVSTNLTSGHKKLL